MIGFQILILGNPEMVNASLTLNIFEEIPPHEKISRKGILMDFKGPLTSDTQTLVNECDQLLQDQERLSILKNTGLMEGTRDRAFDRLAELASKILKVPLTFISLVTDEKQIFLGSFGMPVPYQGHGELPITDSICRYTLNGKEIITHDAKLNPLLKIHPTTVPMGIGAFIAIPMKNQMGHVLGAFCAADKGTRHWSEEEIMVMRELTTSVMTEIELRGQVNELNQERQLRDRFVEALTHDLRTPMAVVKMNIQLLAKRAASAEIDRVSAKISNSVNRMELMIQNLLDTSKLKTGEKLIVRPEECQVNELIHRTVDEMTLLHGERFQLKEDKMIAGTFDSSAVRRILENLLSNAVKYGYEETPITIKLFQLKEGLELTVGNSGKAIPLDEQRKIFEYLHRAKEAVNSHKKGWGLGLSLVKGLAEAHGGSVSVESSGENTSFTVALPSLVII